MRRYEESTLVCAEDAGKSQIVEEFAREKTAGKWEHSRMK